MSSEESKRDKRTRERYAETEGRVEKPQENPEEEKTILEDGNDALNILMAESKTNELDAKMAVLRMQNHSAQLRIDQSKEDNRKLELEVKKMELELQTRAKMGTDTPDRLPPLNADNSSSSVMSVGSRKIRLRDLLAVSSHAKSTNIRVKKEHGTVDENSWKDSNPETSSDSGDSNEKGIFVFFHESIQTQN